MLATITGNDKLAIEQDEANKLATAMQRVARHYDIPGVSQQTLDWIGLIQTAGAIYGTRIMAARLERAARAPAKTEPKVKPIDTSPSAPRPQPVSVSASVPGFGNVDVETPLQ